jgi:hypothetical protein
MTTKEDLEEIYLERARFLLSTDEILEQILGDNDNIIPNILTYQEKDIRIENSIGIENDIRIDNGVETNIELNFA